MDIRISGHQVETGDALKAHVADRLQGIASKYFERAISAEVTFGKGPHDWDSNAISSRTSCAA